MRRKGEVKSEKGSVSWRKTRKKKMSEKISGRGETEKELDVLSFGEVVGCSQECSWGVIAGKAGGEEERGDK
jgi:hypothetical protein